VATETIDIASEHPSFISESNIQILALADKLPRVVQSQYLDQF